MARIADIAHAWCLIGKNLRKTAKKTESVATWGFPNLRAFDLLERSSQGAW
jgi:hypothetical protein